MASPAPDRVRSVVVAWLPAALYMTLIWTISSLETPTFPTSLFPMRDKGVHFAEFAVLGFLLAHACLRTFAAHAPGLPPRRSSWRAVGVAMLAGVLWGLFDEIHQAFVPGRSADVLDLAADTLGTVGGTLARAAVRALVARVRPRAPANSEDSA